MTPPAPRTPKQIMADVKAQHAEHLAAEQAVAEWPPPERYATEVRNLPPGPARIAKLCPDWRATAARGPTGTNEAPGWRMATSVALRGQVGERRFVALWLEKPQRTARGKAAFGLLFAYAHGVEGRVNSEMLTRYLTEDDGIPWLPHVGFIPRTTH